MAKKCTKSVMHVQSCCSALSSYCSFDFLVAAAPLTSYYLRYIEIHQKQNILGANSIATADSIPNVFSTHQKFLRFWLGKWKITVSLARTSLVNEPGKCGETIAIVYELTKRTQEELFADLAQQYKAFLCPIRSRHPPEFLEIVRWESLPRGSFAGSWKLSSRLFPRPKWRPLGLRGC